MNDPCQPPRSVIAGYLIARLCPEIEWLLHTDRLKRL
jgi:hypothetical protein